jgi:hypothetical protein
VRETPKTRVGKRVYELDPKTVALLREHRKAQIKTRLKAGQAGQAWQDKDIFCMPCIAMHGGFV